MNDIIKIVESFEGIIGALLGVIVTLMLTQVLKHWGGIKTYILEWTKTFTWEDGWGGQETTDINEAHTVKLNLQIEIYNGADVPKILRDIKFSLYKGNEFLLSVIPNDQSTMKVSAGAARVDPLVNINIPPKQIITIDISSYLSKDNFQAYKDSTSIFLEMKEHNNKKIKVKL
jgi:hypothetical protein